MANGRGSALPFSFANSTLYKPLFALAPNWSGTGIQNTNPAA